MATTEEVRKLAALARIRVEDSELEKFTSEFDAILAYVGQLEKLELPQGDALRDKPVLRNVMRADSEPHAGGAYTEKLAEQFPQREGDALSVKQIITHTD
ncbi:MAG: Asp-tRNA(Asn)/Glu-tRNA(Gln) amidotransferase subunit GatC [bacterium]|nr:Asp-tRNA(Asn)/Glu-tRNA(Gln) amidotransferase subunit GatC [bacterium]